jgi:hypothetical protein
MILPRHAAACIAASLAACTTAIAQQPKAAPPSDTVKAVIENGSTMKFGIGITIELIYDKDGSLLAEPGDLAGTWEADGPKLCVTVGGYAENQCLVYPPGKKSGDAFDIPTKSAPITITIN